MGSTGIGTPAVRSETFSPWTSVGFRISLMKNSATKKFKFINKKTYHCIQFLVIQRIQERIDIQRHRECWHIVFLCCYSCVFLICTRRRPDKFFHLLEIQVCKHICESHWCLNRMHELNSRSHYPYIRLGLKYFVRNNEINWVKLVFTKHVRILLGMYYFEDQTGKKTEKKRLATISPNLPISLKKPTQFSRFLA